MKELEMVSDILELKFQHQQVELSALIAKEKLLRSSINQLTHQEREAQVAINSELQALGADVMWKAWLGRTRTKLNMDLSVVLAQKEVAMRGTRRAFGKLSVAQELALKTARRSAHDKRKSNLDRAMELSLLKRN
ncbi:MAG: hypothetical protein AAF665_10290 [Pseudomonadota bacterium]